MESNDPYEGEAEMTGERIFGWSAGTGGVGYMPAGEIMPTVSRHQDTA